MQFNDKKTQLKVVVIRQEFGLLFYKIVWFKATQIVFRVIHAYLFLISPVEL